MQLEPSWHMDEQFVVEHHQASLVSDSLDNDPMTRSINTVQQLLKGGAKNKGVCIIRMMEHIFGSEHFTQALRTYLHKM